MWKEGGFSQVDQTRPWMEQHAHLMSSHEPDERLLLPCTAWCIGTAEIPSRDFIDHNELSSIRCTYHGIRTDYH